MTLYKSAKDALAAIQVTGKNRGLETIDQILILSFMAGMYVAFGAYLALLTGGNVPEIRQNNPGLAKLLFGVTFTVGLMFIILTGSDLFTGNSFSIPTSVYSKKTRIWTIIYAIKNIVLTFIGNFLGALFVGFFFVYLLNDGKDAWVGYLKTIAEKKVHMPVWQLFISSIGCNIIVASAVFIVYTAEDVAGKLLATFFPITAFAVYGFEHVVANMFFLPTAAMFGANFQIWEMLVYSTMTLDTDTVDILPVTVGNYLGGALFVGFVFWYAHIWRNKHKDGIKHILIHILRKMNVHVEDHTSDEEHHDDAHQELQHVDDHHHNDHHDTTDHHDEVVKATPNAVMTVQNKV